MDAINPKSWSPSWTSPGDYFLKEIKNQAEVLEIKAMSNILINHLHGLLLKGFDNQDAYPLHVVIATFSCK